VARLLHAVGTGAIELTFEPPANEIRGVVRVRNQMMATAAMRHEIQTVIHWKTFTLIKNAAVSHS
jgi:hypothetical protein